MDDLLVRYEMELRELLETVVADVRYKALDEAADLCRTLGKYSDQQEKAQECEAAIRALRG